MNTGENQLVQKIANALASKGRKRRTSRAGLVLGAGDDAALMASRPGYQTILTCDWFLQGSHFLRDQHPPESIGWKCLARAVSDVAAMGGEPLHFLLSLGLPETHIGKWLDRFLSGLARAQRRLACRLAGGDMTRSHQILINVTVVGEVRKGRAVLRSGAKPGDLIFVSGRLGEAELGLRWLREGGSGRQGNNPCVNKHLYPEPRLALGRWLAEERIATAMMDLSDGLSTDLSRLCAASGVGALVEADRIPKPQLPANKRHNNRNVNLTALAVNGGDDYELLFTVRPKHIGRVPRSFRGLPLSCVGQITRDRHLLLLGAGGQKEKLVPCGWDPFQD
jgi:thiamine-monophosphate kinase